MMVSEAVELIKCELPKHGLSVTVDSAGWVGKCGESAYLTASNGVNAFSVRVSDHGVGQNRLLDHIHFLPGTSTIEELVNTFVVSAVRSEARKSEQKALSVSINDRLIDGYMVALKTSNSKGRRDIQRKLDLLKNAK